MARAVRKSCHLPTLDALQFPPRSDGEPAKPRARSTQYFLDVRSTSRAPRAVAYGRARRYTFIFYLCHTLQSGSDWPSVCNFCQAKGTIVPGTTVRGSPVILTWVCRVCGRGQADDTQRQEIERRAGEPDRRRKTRKEGRTARRLRNHYEPIENARSCRIDAEAGRRAVLVERGGLARVWQLGLD